MKRITLLSLLIVFSLNPANAINFEDGMSHTINDSTYQNEFIDLDSTEYITPGTHLNLIDGGIVKGISAYYDSTVTMDGGVAETIDVFGNVKITMNKGTVNSFVTFGNAIATINGGNAEDYFGASNNSKIFMNGGTTDHFLVYDNAYVNFSGGTVTNKVSTYGNSNFVVSKGAVGILWAGDISTINVYGGAIGSNLFAYFDGRIFLDGTDFRVNGQALSYGDKLSDFATLIEDRDYFVKDYYTGTLTGTLSDGSILSTTFEIYNTGYYEGIADIIIIPEPMTIALFGLGGLILRRKK